MEFLFKKSSEQADLKIYVNQNIVYQYNDNESSISDNKLQLSDKINYYCQLNKKLTILTIILFALNCILPPFIIKIPSLTITNFLMHVLIFGWLFSIVYKIYYKTFKKVKIEYIFDNYGNDYLKNFNNLLEVLRSNSKLWHLKNKTIADKKLKSAAKFNVDLELIKTGRRSAPFISCKIKPFSFKAPSCSFYLYPDTMFIITKKHISILNYNDLDVFFYDYMLINNSEFVLYNDYIKSFHFFPKP